MTKRKETIDTETGEILTHLVAEGRAEIFLRTPYNYDTDAASVETGLVCEEKTLAQQHPKDDVDINKIVERFNLTGQMPVFAKPMTYGDFTGVKDYASAMQVIRDADDQFMQLPAQVRERFRNDPHEFLAFTSDEKNRAEMESMGMIKTTKQDPVRVIVEPPAGGEGGAPAPTPPAGKAGAA